jgi:FtsP/CotA-like multicopper oxidase with cupredoxin domain
VVSRWRRLTRFPAPVTGVLHYTINIRQYADSLHPDLGATTLWGYDPAIALGTKNWRPAHLGGIIVAQKGVPIQLTFRNRLPGQPILPVDTTVSGTSDGPNRTAVHLHGGFVPSCSDGGRRPGSPRTAARPLHEPAVIRGRWLAFRITLNSAGAPTNTPGPSFLQVGTEGGFLSQPVVVPPNVPFNPNKLGGSLILAPAERADIIVDFRGFAGSNLVLYTDAPARPFLAAIRIMMTSRIRPLGQTRARSCASSSCRRPAPSRPCASRQKQTLRPVTICYW